MEKEFCELSESVWLQKVRPLIKSVDMKSNFKNLRLFEAMLHFFTWGFSKAQILKSGPGNWLICQNRPNFTYPGI